jgi:hypothetical protein
MFFLALLTVLMDSWVTVPKSHWIAIEVKIRKPHTVVECSVDVENGSSTLDALLMSRGDAERFNRGRSFRPLVSSGFQSSSRFRQEIEEPGDYVLLLDNRLEGRSATKANVRIELWNADASRVTTVPPQKRQAIVVLSLLFFVGVAAFSARQFLKSEGRA